MMDKYEHMVTFGHIMCKRPKNFLALWQIFFIGAH